MKHLLQIFLLILFWTTFSGQLCTKEVVYGKDYYTEPRKAYFQSDKTSVSDAVHQTLEQLGYEVQNIDESKGRFTTGWQPVEVDSHYVSLFDRKDYGVMDGSYYQLLVDVNEEGTKIKVAVTTKVKTIVGKVYTSEKVERRVLKQLETYLRSPQIELSNVGVKSK